MRDISNYPSARNLKAELNTLAPEKNVSRETLVAFSSTSCYRFLCKKLWGDVSVFSKKVSLAKFRETRADLKFVSVYQRLAKL